MNGFVAVPRQRQAEPTYFRINGAIYLIDVEHLKACGGISYDASSYAYVMPQERSVDIDGPVDFLIAEALLRAGGAGAL